MSAALPSAPAAIAGRWKAYPAYRDSGVEWLGEVPAHWRIRRLKHVTSFVTSGSRGWAQFYSDEGTLFLRIGNIRRASIDLDLSDTQRIVPPIGAEGARTRVEQHDVLISITAFIGSVCVVAEDIGEAYVNQHIALVRPRTDTIDARWLAYCLSSTCGQYQFGINLYGGTKDGLGLDDVRNTLVLYPPHSDQFAIAAFLDRETAKLDTLVAAKERLIELLQEKRAALISQAVTRGLDPVVALKESGVEWLGGVPSHWAVKRLRDIALSLQTGPFGSQLHAEDYSAGGIPVINPAHLVAGSIVPDSDCAVDHETWLRLVRHELLEGDIIFARRGEMGRCALVTDLEAGWLCGTGSLRLRLNVLQAHPPFINWALATSGVRDWLVLESVGSTMDNLNAKILGRLPLSLPTLAEQHAIAAFLARETTKIDALIAKVRQHIALLREYRTALISAAVTGKIDVRGETP